MTCSVCGSDAIDENGVCHGCGATGQLDREQWREWVEATMRCCVGLRPELLPWN